MMGTHRLFCDIRIASLEFAFCLVALYYSAAPSSFEQEIMQKSRKATNQRLKKAAKQEPSDSRLIDK